MKGKWGPAGGGGSPDAVKRRGEGGGAGLGHGVSVEGLFSLKIE